MKAARKPGAGLASDSLRQRVAATLRRAIRLHAEAARLKNAAREAAFQARAIRAELREEEPEQVAARNEATRPLKLRDLLPSLLVLTVVFAAMLLAIWLQPSP